MKYDLFSVRKAYGYTVAQFAKFTELSVSNYVIYERENEIPSKYIYKLWKKIPEFPIPKDFFYYTSATLIINMAYYSISQVEIAEIFGFSTQATVSGYLRENVPMYEKKEEFLKVFQPIIIPFIMQQEGEKDKFYQITNLKPVGNMTEKYSKMAKRRGKIKAVRQRREKELREERKKNNK